MYSLEEFLAEYGEAARRLARTDEALNECLVLPFDQYLEAYNGVWGQPGGYILMRLRYALLKYRRKEYQRECKFVELATDVEAPSFNVIDLTEFNRAFALVDKDMQLVLEYWAAGYSHTEINEELGIGLRKVKARLAAGLEQLKEHYKCAMS